MAVLRVIAAISAAGTVWVVAASSVPDHTRLPLSAIVPYAVVTQPFGCSPLSVEPFDPLCPTRHVHTGIDLAAPQGTPVYSATAGIARVGYDPRGAGVFVAVAYDDHVRLLYCHLSMTAVQTGELVEPGGLLGKVGMTGLATGAHLHFEVQVDGRFVDPVGWLGAA